MAAHMVNELAGINELSVSSWLEYEDIDWIGKCSKPFRKTLLHDYINFIIIEQYEYLLEKHLPIEIIKSLTSIMQKYGVDYSHLGNVEFSKLEIDDVDDVNDELEVYGRIVFRFFLETLEEVFVDDIFTVLFANKEFLFEFNSQVQKLVKNLSHQQYPDLLKKNGVYKRITYLPSWLKNGVFMRDKGRCQICGTDLSKILSLVNAENYDHIIPLEKGGTNDPINFQLTCETCNKSKGDRNTFYSSLGSRYWKIK
ncbi:HNH endonuclease [Lysinibacillus sphaericus]|uniref:HNH endonuclease n=1 Tax=Lysinibacillus sphaericus TaxID=1421 RepID=UPI000C1942DD|nr:HNH endonuclease signature motif containing protein [Lysinibacillus sphaericus]PIJ98007.1 hypothetical protein CTN02_09695 [Lysinibacillus sphaericus]